ncbi:MAG: hypothetical protein IT200_12015 [Thermoleophilia bacterium]|nr:hypothetical protein [Thermoleophilia bacterium]
MRGILAALLALVGLACAVYLQTMSYVGGNVLDSGRFAETTLDVLAGEDGSAAAARAMTAVVDRRAAAQGVAVPADTRAQVQAALTRALRAPGIVDVLRPVVRAAHRALIDGRDARFSLAPLRPQVVRAVEARAPAAVSLVPPEQGFPVVTMPVAWRDAGPVELAGTLRDGRGTALLVAVAAFGLAVAVSRRRPAALVAIGAALCVTAVLPLLVRGGAGAAAAGLVDSDVADPLAQALVEGFTSGYLRATVWTLVAGGAAIASGILAGSRGR